MEDNATQWLEARLDRQQYDDNQLIAIKVPASYLSYFNVSTTFERVSGTIEVGGVPYQFVKRRIYNDSIELMCIPNRAAVKWRQAGNSFFGLVNGVERGGAKSHPSVNKSFLTDPYTSIDPMGLPQSGKSPIIFSGFAVTHPASGFLAAGERPPAVSAALAASI